MSESFDSAAETRLLKARVEAAILQARRLGATACEVVAGASQELDVNVRKGEVDTLTQARDQSLTITVYRGQRQGSASTTDTREEAIHASVAKACDIARFTEKDPAAGLADAALMARELPDMDQYHPWHSTAQHAVELARQCEQAGMAVAGIRNSEGASCSTTSSAAVYGNSHGFIGSQCRTLHGLSCALIAGEGDEMQRDFEYTSARHPDQLVDAVTIGRQAADKALARLGSTRPQTGRYPVLMAPAMARTLVGHLLSAVAGGALYRDASFLQDALGESLFPDWFSLREHPRLPGALASSAFDGEGVFTRDNCFVDRGQLASYLLSSYSARRLGMTTTGNAGGARNLRLEAPLTGYADLIAQIDQGVLITELMGQGVNTVTGDYSRGAAGFWVEKGRISHPVENFTLAANLRDMFSGLRALGDDIDRRGNLQTGSWLIEGITLAS